MSTFLTSIDVIDTGFLDVSTRNGQLPAASRVNAGVALRLKAVNFDISSGAGLDDASTPGFLPSSIKAHEKRSLISVSPTVVTLSIFLNSKNADTDNSWGINDMSLLPLLLRLPHTRGWKALYYAVPVTVDGSVRNRDQQMVYQIGEVDTTESQGDLSLSLYDGSGVVTGQNLTDVRYVPVRVRSVQMTQTPDNRVMVTINGVVTG